MPVTSTTPPDFHRETQKEIPIVRDLAREEISLRDIVEEFKGREDLSPPLTQPAPKKENTTKLEVVEKTKPTVWDQIKSGTRKAFLIIVPSWLMMWLGGGVYSSAVQALGFSVPPPVSNPIPESMKTALQSNSTDNFSLSQSIDSSVQAEKSWDALKTTRLQLKVYSPDLSSWLDGLHDSGKLVFSAEPFAPHRDRYSDFRKWNGELRVYPDFFNINDGEKIAIIRHEYSHAREDAGKYISSSLSPQVVIGALTRGFGMMGSSAFRAIGDWSGRNFVGSAFSKMGDWCDTQTAEDSWSAMWQYYASRAEVDATNEEKLASDEFGIPVEVAGHQDLRNDSGIIPAGVQIPSSEIPGQTASGIILASYLGYRWLLRRRNGSQSSAPSLKVVTNTPKKAAA